MTQRQVQAIRQGATLSKGQIKRYLDYRERVGWAAKPVMNGDPIAGPVAVEIVMHAPARGRADLDNIAKGILDGMNRIVFEDDRQVWRLLVRWEPCDALYTRVEVTVRELRGEERRA